jgi:acyl-coenzyme A thioesterase 9
VAGDCSYKYLLDSKDVDGRDIKGKDYYLVTVSVDRMDFIHSLDVKKDLKFSSYMLMANGSSLMIKIDVLQRESEGQKWQVVGDAVFIFVARDSKTHKAYRVPTLRASPHDNLSTVRNNFEVGLTIKEWSKDKSLRDLHSKLPEYDESEHYNTYLDKVLELRKTNPEQVVTTAQTKTYTTELMQMQDRNIHGKVFGGYLMREAFDISFITAMK